VIYNVPFPAGVIPGTKWTFHLTQSDESQPTLEGAFAKAALNMRLRKVDESKFTLVGRRFHWINEYPFNK
jgi:hypothetical protein